MSAVSRVAAVPGKAVALERVAAYPRMRALAWHGDALYASRGYTLLRGRMAPSGMGWQRVAGYRPAWWRNLTMRSQLGFRLVRDGFHALAVLSSGDLVAVVPGAIVRLARDEEEFRVTHKVLRGTRPLHIAGTADDRLFWGEYFDNARRDEVHIYGSGDGGASWNVVHTFSKGAIRHVHNIVYDPWGNCLWVLTGDDGAECRILRASCDFRSLDVALAGNQQARAVALVCRQDGLYFSSDTPSESNYVYHLDRRGNLSRVAPLSSSSIYGCSAGAAIFFSTMVEPSAVNRSREVCVVGSSDGLNWNRLLTYNKDRWPLGLFQYGNALFPDGANAAGVLAVTTVAVEQADLETSLWRVKTVVP